MRHIYKLPSLYLLISANRLILSFPFHRNLNMIELIDLFMVLSKLIRDARYMNLGKAKALMAWILPIIVRFLHCQEFKVLLRESKIVLKLSSCMFQTPVVCEEDTKNLNRFFCYFNATISMLSDSA